MRKATARAGSNIAFVKYWGAADPALNLPLNSSISMTLAHVHTTTTVEWSPRGERSEDEITLNGLSLDPARAERLVAHLDRIRALAGVDHRARVVSVNNFPTGAGIASSASGFAALTVAACRALGLDLSPTQLSALARRGSGSACRSLFGGFVEWRKGTSDADSVAVPLFPPDHWDLWDLVAVVDRQEKPVSSAQGHRLAHTSPLLEGRLRQVEGWLDQVRSAIERRDIHGLGTVAELDALAMHSVMMTSTPSLLYWQPGTVAVLHAVRAWRAEGLPVYFTIDAGPNVHLLCPGDQVPALRERLASVPGVEQVIASGPGPGPRLLESHLF